MEKSFVDLYLLDMDQKILQKYQKALYKVKDLNIFEKCLFVEVLVRNKQVDLAKRLAKESKEYVLGYWGCENEDREQNNSIFDLILNMNSTSKKPKVLQS